MPQLIFLIRFLAASPILLILSILAILTAAVGSVASIVAGRDGADFALNIFERALGE